MTTTSAPPSVIGFVGFLDDIRSRAEALGEGDIPLSWTPEHVQNRMVEAFDILMRSGTRVGPGRHGNGWPAMIHEFSDLVDAQARAIAEKEKQQARAARPTADELSRMNEALAWPMNHLDGLPLQADALMLWAYATAAGRDMAAMLHHRKKKAATLAEEMARRRNALPYGRGETGAGDTRSLADQWRAALRQLIIRELVAAMDMQRAALDPDDREGRTRINREGLDEARRRLKLFNCEHYRVQPHEAVPGRCLSRTNLDRQRKIAAAAVAAGLQRQGVAVR